MLLHLINISYSITEDLYNSAQETIADRICNIYGSRGYEFLRDIYEKHQKINWLSLSQTVYKITPILLSLIILSYWEKKYTKQKQKAGRGV